MTIQQFGARGCPVCAGRESRKLFRQSFEQLSGARLLDGYDVVVCTRCGAGYADDIPAQDAFDLYYRDLSKYDYNDRAGDARPRTDPRFFETADTFAAAISSSEARILEIGSASGELLDVLKQRGFKHVIGIDPSPGCCEAAMTLYGVTSFVGTIFDVPEFDRSHDFLILVGVLEHIRDLDRAVDGMSPLLADGGRVYVEVPDASRFDAGADAPFQEFSVEHINFLSVQSLTNLMCSRGFRVLETGRAVRALHDIGVPVAFGVYEKGQRRSAIVKDAETEARLRAYIAGGLNEDERVRAQIENAVRPGERIIVWGVGTHTQRLLANGGLNPDKIVMFVDSNPKYQAQRLHGIPVVAPETLRERSEAILISSRGLQQEIYYQIRQGLAISNPVIQLYGSA